MYNIIVDPILHYLGLLVPKDNSNENHPKHLTHGQM